MIGRIAFYGLLLALAGLVVSVQLDRQALDDPQLGLVVPEPLRAVAQERLLEAQLVAGGTAQSAGMARELLRRRPLPARHLVLLAQAAQVSGDTDLAIRALEGAALRGWREPFPQLAVAQAGVISGNYPSAAQRIAALTAMGGYPEETNRLLGIMLDSAEGREALASQMALGGRWTKYFAGQLAQAGTLEQFADTIERARAKGALLDCGQLQAVAERGLADGEEDLVARFWPGACPAR
ncbi:hypothetical protein GCM10009127_03320 [Alteraurantiacibacter aestuarii]|nr:hypothetical protein [Alteraurantiacibacter aestuarii]